MSAAVLRVPKVIIAQQVLLLLILIVSRVQQDLSTPESGWSLSKIVLVRFVLQVATALLAQTAPLTYEIFAQQVPFIVLRATK